MIDFLDLIFRYLRADSSEGLQVANLCRFHRDTSDSVEHCFINSDCIVVVILLTRDKWLDGLRRHQMHFMPHGLKLSSPVLRSTAGFHPDKAFSPVSEEIEKLSSFDLFVSDFSVSGDKMNLHYFFGKVHARKTRVLCMIVHEELL